MHRILVVDDDPHIRDVICFALEKAGMTTDSARNGSDALRQVELRAPSLIVLDVGMPEMDGLEVCRRLRKSSDVPILFLSARDEEIDRVLGLEMGGDDYVTKPFSPRELVARVNVILRRSKAGNAGEARNEQPRSHGQLVIDPGRHMAAIGGSELGLTAVEFSILGAMAARPSFVFTREQLMTAAYDGKVHVSDRTIDSHIRNIRAKCAGAGCSNAVETVHGVGFRLGLCEVERP
ncbi:two-component system, OmpR family, response regulator [Rhizobiales bacterium GAS191]|nr:two-component system, OmpR family, response regulator [Rhizobiales bacterium GAS191]